MATRLLLLVTGDVLLAVLSVQTGFIIRYGRIPLAEDLFGMGGARIAFYAGILVFISFFVELYNNERNTEKKEVVVRVVTSLGISFFVLSSLYYMMPGLLIGRGVLALSLLSFAFFQSLWHLGYQMSLNFSGFAHRVLILGTGPLAMQMGRAISAANHPYVLMGYINCADEAADLSMNIVGSGEGLIETARRQRADKIVVSLSERRGAFPLKDVLKCKLRGIDVVDAPSFYEQITGKLLIENINPSWFIFSDGFRMTAARMFFKRVLDAALAIIGLAVTLPFIPVLALLVKLDSPGPVFFKQVRMGQMEKLFTLYKFRTMREDAENGTGAVWAQKNDTRVTKLGRIFRKLRIDEIPQLYNVLKGDMSMVGPRPERPEFIEKLKEVIPYYSERHLVRPGITGWAQVKYPYGASVEDAVEKLRYDLFYIKNHYFTLDLLIILETMKVVVFGRGGR